MARRRLLLGRLLGDRGKPLIAVLRERVPGEWWYNPRLCQWEHESGRSVTARGGLDGGYSDLYWTDTNRSVFES